ncbi:MAG: DNA recombination protein RmuC [Spirochaetaceae bacterium]
MAEAFPEAQTLLLTALLVIAGLILVLVMILLLRRTRGTGEDGSGTQARLEHISKSLAELEQVFALPRSRGAVGETLLSRLLEDWLPRASFELQYSFSDGTRVDAVVKLGRYLVPIDAKFPFEAAKRAMASESSAGGDAGGADGRGGGAGGTGRGGGTDGELRKAFMRHVEDIAQRYIRPGDGTLGFALMYIPSERVYQYVFVDAGDDLLGEAMGRGVVPVSPSTLFLYLQTVAYGLRGFTVSRDARAILSRVNAARTEGQELARAASVARTHIKNLGKAFDDVENRVERLREKLELPHEEGAE